MKNIFIILFLLQMFLNASFLDEYYIFKAQVNYKDKDFKSSLEFYKKIENKTNQIYYNIGNILYKQKEYKKAINEYKKMNSIELNYKKLHNIGNCYIGLKQLDEAIIFYKSALKFNGNKNTKYNLTMALDIRKQIQKIEKIKALNKKNSQDSKLIGRNGKSDDIILDDSDNKNKINVSEDKKNINIKSDNISNIKSKQINEEVKNMKNIDTNGTIEDVTTKTLSALEEYKWDKLLKNRTVKTLLIPLDTKGMKNEKYPW